MKRPSTSPAGAMRGTSASLPSLLLSRNARKTKQQLRGLITSPQKNASGRRTRILKSPIATSPNIDNSELNSRRKKLLSANDKMSPHLLESAEHFVNFLQTDWKTELETRVRNSTKIAKKRSEVKRAAKRLVDGTADFMGVQVESFRNFMCNEWPGVKTLIGERTGIESMSEVCASYGRRLRKELIDGFHSDLLHEINAHRRFNQISLGMKQTESIDNLNYNAIPLTKEEKAAILQLPSKRPANISTKPALCSLLTGTVSHFSLSPFSQTPYRRSSDMSSRGTTHNA